MKLDHRLVTIGKRLELARLSRRVRVLPVEHEEDRRETRLKPALFACKLRFGAQTRVARGFESASSRFDRLQRVSNFDGNGLFGLLAPHLQLPALGEGASEMPLRRAVSDWKIDVHAEPPRAVLVSKKVAEALSVSSDESGRRLIERRRGKRRQSGSLGELRDALEEHRVVLNDRVHRASFATG